LSPALPPPPPLCYTDDFAPHTKHSLFHFGQHLGDTSSATVFLPESKTASKSATPLTNNRHPTSWTGDFDLNQEQTSDQHKPIHTLKLNTLHSGNTYPQLQNAQ